MFLDFDQDKTGFIKAKDVILWLGENEDTIKLSDSQDFDEAYYNLTQRSLYTTPYDIYDSSDLYSEVYGCTQNYLENMNLSKDINDSLRKIGQFTEYDKSCSAKGYKVTTV